MGGESTRAGCRILAAAAAFALAVGTAGCGTPVPAAGSAGSAPAAVPFGSAGVESAPPGSLARDRAAPEPPQRGVPAETWHALTGFVKGRAGSRQPLPAPEEAPDCLLPGSGCSWSFGAETLVWSAAAGTRALRTEVFTHWKSSGRALGWPVTSEYPYKGDYRTDFQKGSLVYVPRLGRIMAFDPGVESSAVVIGDSQAGIDTWVGQGLASLGYAPVIRGAGGTGYTRGNGTVHSYAEALAAEEWLLPWGEPALVVLQGGGNDAAGASDRAIRHGANRLIREIRRTYPETRIVVVGVIGSGSGRRGEIDDLLGEVAAGHGLDFLSVKDWWSRYSLGSKLTDKVHLGQSGHDAAAPVFARELKKVLDRSGARPAGGSGS